MCPGALIAPLDVRILGGPLLGALRIVPPPSGMSGGWGLRPASMVSVTGNRDRAAEFVGVSQDASRGVQFTGPYEFLTATGVPVHLHDTDFLGLVWRPEMILCIYFAYDPEWTPPEARETPVVELIF